MGFFHTTTITTTTIATALSFLLWKSTTTSVVDVFFCNAQKTTMTTCFDNTNDIIDAQLMGIKEIIICSNTIIDIGIPNNAELTEYINGQPPLSILDDDVSILCGDENGSSSNNCILNGGLIQIVSLPGNPFAPDRIVTTNNLLIKGITFTGEQVGTPNLGAVSIGLLAEGTNIILDDLIFNELNSNIYVLIANEPGITPPSLTVESGKIDVTIKNTIVTKSIYTDSIFQNEDQNLYIDNVIFQDLTYETCGCPHGGIIECWGSQCYTELINDIMFDNVTVLTSPIVSFYDADITYDNDDTIITTSNVVARNDDCSKDGFMTIVDEDDTIIECIELTTTSTITSPNDKDDSSKKVHGKKKDKELKTAGKKKKTTGKKEKTTGKKETTNGKKNEMNGKK